MQLSNPDRLLYPKDRITKADVAAYYEAVAGPLLRALAGRPLAVVHWNQGIEKSRWFQQNTGSDAEPWMTVVETPLRTKGGAARHLVADRPETLRWLAQHSALELHIWHSRMDSLTQPDWVLFDLDPSPDVGFKETVQVALIVKAALDVLGLESFPKTSSADGMHVLVPVERRYTYDDTREFSEIVASAIARTHRGLATTEWVKSKRRGVLVDSNQNGEGKTIASAYSVRPRPGAPVSAPLRWDEVTETLDPSTFTMDVVLERVRVHGDLFEGVLTTRQRLDRALKTLR